MIIPIYAGLERIPTSLLEASSDLGGAAADHVPAGHPAAGPAGRRRRLDLHVQPDPRRLHHADPRLEHAVHRQRRLRHRGRRRATSRWPRRSRWSRSRSCWCTCSSPAGSARSRRSDAPAARAPDRAPRRDRADARVHLHPDRDRSSCTRSTRLGCRDVADRAASPSTGTASARTTPASGTRSCTSLEAAIGATIVALVLGQPDRVRRPALRVLRPRRPSASSSSCRWPCRGSSRGSR